MNTTAKVWMAIAVVLFIVILVMTYLLFALPGGQTVNVTPDQPATSTGTSSAVPPPGVINSTPVKVTTPASHTTVGSTFEVKGTAPGPWYFEATFPIQVRDKEGNVIGRGHANAQGEWMTTADVPFQATVTLDVAYKGAATLILMKDNPSGMPENDDAVEIPIAIQ